jgi:hypothetical protein
MRERIERFRAELRESSYPRITEDELAERLELDIDAKASNAIEGLYADAAEEALLGMLAEERVPASLAVSYIIRFYKEEQDYRDSR